MELINYSKDDWEIYLNRRFTDSENVLFCALECERNMNSRIKALNELLKEKNLVISHLTENNGDCLFESLCLLGIGKNRENFRRSLAYLMLIFKDYPNFFDGQSESLKEIFLQTNDIELVHSKEQKDDEIYSHIYKYTYEVMCNDLACVNNWLRIPTQLILMFVSKIYNVEISIMNDSGYLYSITSNQDIAPTKIIRLAHVGELHYLPIGVRTEDSVNLQYAYIYNKFHHWVKIQSFMRQMTHDNGQKNIQKNHKNHDELDE